MKEIEDLHNAHCIPMRNISIAKGKGCKVWDTEGKEYLDCISGFGVSILGHCNDSVNKALEEQLQTLSSNPQILYTPARAKAFQKLSQMLPKELSRVFFTNSGTESVECALKIARKFTGKKEFISMKKSFHGRSMGSLSATWNQHYRKNFEPLVPGISFAEFNNLESVKKLANENTAAVILEPVQGEGGVFPATNEFIQGLREFCNSKGILLIFDEVQTGFGRTGKFFALEHYKTVPDIICLNKGMGNGFPVGATAAKPEIFEALETGEHMSTLGGNPLACTAASATIDFILKEKLCENSEKMGNYFIESLNCPQNKSIREVRGKGLMIGIELKFPAMKFILEAMEKGVLFYNAGLNTIRLLPPLIISKAEVDKACSVLEEVL